MDDLQKQRFMAALIGFNLTIIVFQIGFNSGLFGAAFSMVRLIIGIVIALVVGSGCFFVAKMMQR